MTFRRDDAYPQLGFLLGQRRVCHPGGVKQPKQRL